METVSDESRKKELLEQIIKIIKRNPKNIESFVNGLTNETLINLYDYCSDESQKNEDDIYWFIVNELEKLDIIRKYKGGKLYVDNVIGLHCSRLEEMVEPDPEIQRSLDETAHALDENKKNKKSKFTKK